MDDRPSHDNDPKPTVPFQKMATRLPQRYLASNNTVLANNNNAEPSKNAEFIANQDDGMDGVPALRNAVSPQHEDGLIQQEKSEYERIKAEHGSRPLGSSFKFTPPPGRGPPGLGTAAPQKTALPPENYRVAPGSTEVPSRQTETGGHLPSSTQPGTSAFPKNPAYSRGVVMGESGEKSRGMGHQVADNTQFQDILLTRGESPRDIPSYLAAHENENRGQEPVEQKLPYEVVRRDDPNGDCNDEVDTPGQPTLQQGVATNLSPTEHTIRSAPVPERYPPSKANTVNQLQDTGVRTQKLSFTTLAPGEPTEPLPSEYNDQVHKRLDSRSPNISKRVLKAGGGRLMAEKFIPWTQVTQGPSAPSPQGSGSLPLDGHRIAMARDTKGPSLQGMSFPKLERFAADWQQKITRETEQVKVRDLHIQKQKAELETHERKAQQSSQERADLERRLKEAEGKLSAKDARVTTLEEKVKALPSFMNSAVREHQKLHQKSKAASQQAMMMIRDEEKAHRNNMDEILKTTEATRAALEERTKTVVADCKNRELELVNKVERLTEQLRDRDSKLHHEEGRVTALTTQLNQASETMKLDLQSLDCRAKETLQKLKALYAGCAEVTQAMRKDERTKFVAISEKLDLLATMIPDQEALQSTMDAFAQDEASRILSGIQKVVEHQIRNEDLTSQVGTSLESQMAGMWRHFMDREDSISQQLKAMGEENAMLTTLIDEKEVECQDLSARIAELDGEKAAHICQAIPLPQSPPDADAPEIVKVVWATQEEVSQLRGEVATKDSLVSQLQSQFQEKEQQMRVVERGYTDDVKSLTETFQKLQEASNKEMKEAVDAAHQEATRVRERDEARGKDLLETESRKVDDLKSQLQASKETIATIEESQRRDTLQAEMLKADFNAERSAAEKAAQQSRDRIAEVEEIRERDSITITELSGKLAAANALATKLEGEKRVRDGKLASLYSRVERWARGYGQLTEITTHLRELAEIRSRSSSASDIISEARCVEALFEELEKHHHSSTMLPTAASASLSTQATGLTPGVTMDSSAFSLRGSSKQMSRRRTEVSSQFDRLPGHPGIEIHTHQQLLPPPELNLADPQEFQAWGQDARRVMLQSPHGVRVEPDPPSVGEEQARRREAQQPISIMKTRSTSRLEEEVPPVLPALSARRSRMSDTSGFVYGRYNRPVSGGALVSASLRDHMSPKPSPPRHDSTLHKPPQALTAAPGGMDSKEAVAPQRGASRKRKLSGDDIAVPREDQTANRSRSAPKSRWISRTYGPRRITRSSQEPSTETSHRAGARNVAKEKKTGPMDDVTQEPIPFSQQSQTDSSEPS